LVSRPDAFALQRAIGIRGDATIAILPSTLFLQQLLADSSFCLLLRLGVPKGFPWLWRWPLPFSCLSDCSDERAEVALALPFFLGTLLVFADREFLGYRPSWRVFLPGWRLFLFAGRFMVPCITIAVISSGLFRSHNHEDAFPVSSAFA